MKKLIIILLLTSCNLEPSINKQDIIGEWQLNTSSGLCLYWEVEDASNTDKWQTWEFKSNDVMIWTSGEYGTHQFYWDFSTDGDVYHDDIERPVFIEDFGYGDTYDIKNVNDKELVLHGNCNTWYFSRK